MTTLSDRLRAIPNGSARADELDAIAERWWEGRASMAEYNLAFWPALKWERKHCDEA